MCIRDSRKGQISLVLEGPALLLFTPIWLLPSGRGGTLAVFPPEGAAGRATGACLGLFQGVAVDEIGNVIAARPAVLAGPLEVLRTLKAAPGTKKTLGEVKTVVWPPASGPPLLLSLLSA